MNGLLIDYEYCSGCRSCELACKNAHDIPLGMWGIKVASDGPWQLPDGSWHFDHVPIPTELCDLCADRVAKGKLPACVHHCQAHVMEYGTLEELEKRAEELGRKTVIFRP